jgi:hypothetical protein
MKKKPEIKIDKKHWKESKFENLSSDELLTLEFLETEIRKVTSSLFCYLHPKAVFQINLKYSDFKQQISVLVCCQTFGLRVKNELNKTNVDAHYIYVKPIDRPNQN